jgi:Cdc6-like AAA superfamily ATPase
VPIDAWLPVGYLLPDGAKIRKALHEGADWQIFETRGGGRALVARDALGRRWLEKLIAAGDLVSFAFGGETFWALTSSATHSLAPIAGARSANSVTDALAFADALRATRERDAESGLQDGLYVEKLSRVLPTHGLSARQADDVVLGAWLTGGVPVSVTSFRRLRALVGWMAEPHLREVIQRAGLSMPASGDGTGTTADAPPRAFSLAGRRDLEAFLREHVIDIVEHRERYRALGITFPSAIVLHGPPGCGKTFAVDRLVDYLGWPSFRVDAGSVASPYIHETSRKVAGVFDDAMKHAPAVVIIDEMEAFLADRDSGRGASHHRVEEVAEFLRRIPEAAAHEVLVIAMTNRIEMIDPAILRRGRFDHVVRVGMPSETEVLSLLEALIGEVPREPGLDLRGLAAALGGRPLSDVAFVVKEGARLAARAGKDRLDLASLDEALAAAPARGADGADHRKIGFL